MEILGRMPASIAGSLAVAMVQVSRERGAGTRRALSLTGVNIGVYCTSHDGYASLVLAHIIMPFATTTFATAWENPTPGKPLDVS